MASTAHRRKILIFGDDPSIRNLLHVLMEKLGRKDAGAADGRPVVATISRQEFEAVLLDLRCSNRQSEDGIQGIAEIWPSLVGRVLVITAEVSDLKTLQMVEQHLRLQPSRNGVLHDLASRLGMLLRMVPSPQPRVTLNSK